MAGELRKFAVPVNNDVWQCNINNYGRNECVTVTKELALLLHDYVLRADIYNGKKLDPVCITLNSPTETE